MKKPKILTGYSNYSNAKLVKKTNEVIVAMTGNSDFVKPVPSIATLQTGLRNLTNAMALARNKDPQQIINRNEMRAALIEELVKLSSYVTFTSGGGTNRKMMAGSALPMSKESSNSIPLQKPQNFQVVVGKNPGEATVSMDSVPGAKSYDFYFQTQALATSNGPWFHKPSRYRYFKLTNLTSMTVYCFQGSASGINNTVENTEIITKGVL